MSGQTLDQFDFNQRLPVPTGVLSPQSQQGSLLASDVGSPLGSAHGLGELDGLNHDAMLNAWSLPEIDATLFGTAPGINWDGMDLPDFAQLPAGDWPVDDSLLVGNPSHESWFLDTNALPREHEGHEQQENQDHGSPVKEENTSSGRLQP